MVKKYVFVSQSNQVAGSYHMEKEGLIQSLKVLGDNCLTVKELVTDRYVGISLSLSLCLLSLVSHSLSPLSLSPLSLSPLSLSLSLSSLSLFQILEPGRCWSGRCQYANNVRRCLFQDFRVGQRVRFVYA